MTTYDNPMTTSHDNLKPNGNGQMTTYDNLSAAPKSDMCAHTDMLCVGCHGCHGCHKAHGIGVSGMTTSMTTKPGGCHKAPTPLDTPHDWHDSIARRAAEWRDLGPEAAIRAWNARGECSRAVMDCALADLAARRAGEAVRRG